MDRLCALIMVLLVTGASAQDAQKAAASPENAVVKKTAPPPQEAPVVETKVPDAKQTASGTPVEKAVTAAPIPPRTDSAAGKPATVSPPSKAAPATATVQAKPTQQPTPSQGLALSRGVVCLAVDNRAPVGEGSTFDKSVGALFCFSHLTGAQGETAVIHRWSRGGQATSEIVLPVNSSDWRTHSRKVIGPEMTGKWMVEILEQASSAVLGKIEFTVQ